MKYQIFILRRAQKELTQLPSDIYKRICETIRNLSLNPRPAGCLKLTGRDGWRIRVGKYRIIFEIDATHRHLTILDIGHRKNIY